MTLFELWKTQNETICSHLFDELRDISAQYHIELLNNDDSFDSFLEMIYQSMKERNFEFNPFYEPTIYEMDVLQTSP